MISKRTPLRMGITFDDVLLVPSRTSATSRALVDVSSHLTNRIALRVPIVSANTPWCTGAAMATEMAKLGGIGLIHRMCAPEDEAQAVAEAKRAPFSRRDHPDVSVGADGRLLVGAAIGAQGDHLERAELLVRSGADVLVVDIAHGHADYCIRTVEILKRRYPEVGVIAGNIATAVGARDLIGAGADAVKVGIGPGAVCTTRLVAGAGVPQITAILDCVEEARASNVPVIADGGIRSSGDMVKAIAAGASTVMLGSMLAGVDESAAQLVEVDGVKYKMSTGFVTFGVKLTLKRLQGGAVSEEELSRYVPEGVEGTFKYRGSLRETLLQYVGGMQSGMSYSGAMTVPELWEKAEFIQVSQAGLVEGRPHVLEASRQVQPDYKAQIAASRG